MVEAQTSPGAMRTWYCMMLTVPPHAFRNFNLHHSRCATPKTGSHSAPAVPCCWSAHRVVRLSEPDWALSAVPLLYRRDGPLASRRRGRTDHTTRSAEAGVHVREASGSNIPWRMCIASGASSITCRAS